MSTATTSVELGRADYVRNLFARNPVLGPTAALVVAVLFFSVATSTFANVDNFSFIVTLGMLVVMTAVTNLYSKGTTWPVPDGLLTWLGTSLFLGGRIQFTMGMVLAAVLFVVVWFVLAKSGWGRHVYAVGNEPEAARLTGIHIDR